MNKKIVALAIVAILIVASFVIAQGDIPVLQHILGKPAPKQLDVDTVHGHGVIKEIKQTTEDSLEITITTEKEDITFVVNTETYIGNYTKSPQKPLSYLKEEMKIDVNYYEKSSKIIATSINVIE